MGDVMAVSAALAAGAMVVVWAVSLPLRDVSIVDVWWGPGFAALAWAAVAVAGPSPRGLGVALAVTAWGLRLGLHLAARRRGQGEDRRYGAMRAAWGPRFRWVSLATVFLLQAALMWIVALPVQAAVARGGASPLGPLDLAGALLFAAGLAFEAVADAQLARFLAQPGSRGRVLETGLWRYTRHPNYFGDALAWWGLGLAGLAAGAWWALAGPALLTFLLRRVSGVTLLEATITERRPGYAAYVARTSAFFPLPPRRG